MGIYVGKHEVIFNATIVGPASLLVISIVLYNSFNVCSVDDADTVAIIV